MTNIAMGRASSFDIGDAVSIFAAGSVATDAIASGSLRFEGVQSIKMPRLLSLQPCQASATSGMTEKSATCRVSRGITER